MNYLKYTYFIFDLDNTLYDENLYLFPVYRRISKFCATNYGVKETEVYHYLTYKFLKLGRHKLFDNLISDFNLPKETINHFLYLLRTIQLDSKINLNHNIEDFLISRKNSINKFYILTNGNSLQQRNKIMQINWKGLSEIFSIVYAGDYPYQKPDKRLFYDIGLSENNKNETLMIGDSIIDEEFALKVGIDFLNVECILL